MTATMTNLTQPSSADLPLLFPGVDLSLGDLVVDIANFAGSVPVSHFEKLVHDNIYKGAYIGTQFPDITRIQVVNARTARFPVLALYCFVYWWDEAADYVRLDDAIGLAQMFGLRVLIDCEWDTAKNKEISADWPVVPMMKPPAMVKRIKAYKAYLRAAEEAYLGIYTGKWWWEPFTKNNTDFASDPLAHAGYYNDRHIPDVSEFEPYGGWDVPNLWQYTERGGQLPDLYGLNADVNVVINPYAPTALPQPAEPTNPNPDPNPAPIVVESEPEMFHVHNAVSAWYDDPSHQEIGHFEDVPDEDWTPHEGRDAGTDGPDDPGHPTEDESMRPTHRVRVGASLGVDARSDFSLPPGITDIEVEIYTKTDAESTPLHVYHGVPSDEELNSGVGYAWQVEAPSHYEHGRVQINADGWFTLVAEEAHVRRIGCTGYYT